MANFSEHILESHLVDVLARNGISCEAQVPIFNRTVDVVGELGSGALFAIECKVHDWRRAIEQAAAHRNTFDFVYICLPDRKISDDLIMNAAAKGVGVLTISIETSRVVEFLPARKNESLWPPNGVRMRTEIRNRKRES